MKVTECKVTSFKPDVVRCDEAYRDRLNAKVYCTHVN